MTKLLSEINWIAEDATILVHHGEVMTKGDDGYFSTNSDWQIIAGPAELNALPEVPFSIADWFDQPSNIKGTNGKWYQVIIVES